MELLKNYSVWEPRSSSSSLAGGEDSLPQGWTPEAILSEATLSGDKLTTWVNELHELAAKACLQPSQILSWLQTTGATFVPARQLICEYCKHHVSLLKLQLGTQDYEAARNQCGLLDSFPFNTVAHLSPLNRILKYMDRMGQWEARRCSTEPYKWIPVSSVADANPHPNVREDMCVFNMPQGSANGEKELENALEQLELDATNEDCTVLYHGTTWSSALKIVHQLRLTNGPSDFVPDNEKGFYLGSSWQAAREWAEKLGGFDDPAVMVFVVPGSLQDIIAHPANLALDGNLPAWNKLVNGCRLNTDFKGDWRAMLGNCTSISGAIGFYGKTTGTYFQSYLWQIAIVSEQRLLTDIIPAM